MIEEERDTTGQYLNDIGARRLLTAEEELCMAMQIKAGDEHVRAQFVEANLKLVVSVAKRYQGRGLATGRPHSRGQSRAATRRREI